jgi:CO/xanthine dehydrogenase Mo-binding subunit
MLAIAVDGGVSIVCPSSEMGQGTQEALARLIAEELDCAWDKVTVRLPWADPAFINPAARHQLTANSMTVMGYFTPLRTLGAAARAMLLQVAATRLGVAAYSLTTASGIVSHAVSGRTLSYGTLAGEAAMLPVPAQVALKQAKDFRLIGKASPRKDLAAKVTGSAEFGIDVHEAGMLSAALALAPHPAATFTVAGVDEVKAMPGVVAVVPVAGGMAVIADRFWRAKQAAEKLTITVTASPIAGLDDAGIAARIEAGFTEVPPAAVPDLDLSVFPPKQKKADPAAVAAALAAAPKRIEARYEVPYLAHATMEPLCCSARLKDGELLVRGPLQDPESAREVAAKAAGLPLDKVRVEVTFIGGGFGRKWSTDFVVPAVQAALAAPGHMVKTLWTREQDFAADQYRPAFVVKSTAGIGKQGEILAMHSRIAGQSIAKYHHRSGPPGLKGLADPGVAAMLIYGAYDFPQKLIEFHAVDIGLPVGFWRSVTMSQNAFFAESMIDEIARATHQDPWQMRRKLLEKQPRLLAVLDRAAEMIGWNTPKMKGIGRGIAISYAEANFCAQAVEVEVKRKKLTIRHIVCAFDCGLMIDPVSVEAQISGGIVFGLQAALWGHVGFADGRTTSANFSDYRMPLLADTPPIEVALMPGSDRPGNAGEAGTPPIAPALVNAIADAGGPRIRRLPVAATLDI